MAYFSGARLRQLRILKRMSLADVSSRTGIAIPQLSRIENGKVDPRISTVVRILSCLDAGLADLEPTRPETMSLDDVLAGAARGARILEDLGIEPSDPDSRLDWKENKKIDVSAERDALTTRS